MWWQKLSKSVKSTEERSREQTGAAEEGQFDFERTLRELQERKEDIRPSDIVLFAEPLRSTLNFAVRVGRVTLTELAEMMKMDRAQVRQITDLLVDRNLFQIHPLSNENETIYQSRLSAMTRPMSRPPSDIWKKLDE